VRAASERDALVGLGYCEGRDRLWQLDYLRREALGTLSELLGTEAHASDLRMRTVGIDLVATSEAERMDPETRSLVDGFVVGVNLAIEAQRGALPIEFELLEYEPEQWTLRDTIAVFRGLWWQLNGRLETIVAAEAARRLLPDDALYAAFTTPELPDERIIPSTENYPRRADGTGAGTLDAHPTGSNNWVISAARSTTGQALLASDPHLPFVNPSDFYEAHLSWPGHDVVGAHWAGVPGVQFGYNGRVAWGLTNNAASARDLYVEDVDPAQPDSYRRGDRWLPYQHRTVEIAVRGEAPRQHEIRSTDLGPVMNATVQPAEEGGDPPLSMRWVGLEHLDDIRSLLAVGRAQSWPEMRAALADWSLPVWNWTYADVDGRVAYQCAGRVPLRGRVTRGYRDPNEPTDGWHGYVDYDLLPRLDNPKRGYHHTANNRVAPDDYAVPLHGAWAGGNRATRVRDRIEAVPAVSPEESRSIQHDVFLIRAARMAPPLARILADSDDAELRRAADLLASWDFRYALDTPAPTVFEAIVHHLAERVVLARVPRRLLGLLHGNGVALASRLLEGEPIAWFESATLDAEVVAAAREGLAFLRRRFGGDLAAWSWGKVHTITFVHPLASSNTLASDGQLGSDGPFPLAGAFAEVANVGPAPVPGAADTVRNAAGRIDHDFGIVSGAEYRLLVDFAATPAALGINVLGQSGQPGSNHQRDQLADWVGDGYHPLLIDWPSIQAAAAGRVEIGPS
jgi:penicillin amidase